MKDPIVGIDLGTSNSVVAHADEVGVVKVLADDGGYKIHPSVVSFHPNGGVVVGAGAKQRKVIDPSNTIYSVKRLIGRAYDSPEVKTLKERVPYQLKEGENKLPLIVTRGGEFAPPEISAIVLDHMRNIAAARLETAVNRAVVTVPASFNDAQRSATATSGAIAGLTVVRVLNEPTAAALAYGNTRNLKEVIAVYDFGGGTFDITILKLNDQVYEVLGTSGDTFLGGDDLDERLVDKMVAKFLQENRIDLRSNEVSMMRLRAVAEQTKIELSRRSRAVVRIDEIAYGAKGKPLNLHIEITRDEFVSQVADIIDRTFPVCQESLQIAGLTTQQIDDVILVGGCTKIPYVRDQVSKFFAKSPRTDVNPEDAVAVGAALQANSLERILSRPRTSSKSIPVQRPPSESLSSVDSFTDADARPPQHPELPMSFSTDQDEATNVSPIPKMALPPLPAPQAAKPTAPAETAYSLKRPTKDQVGDLDKTRDRAPDTNPSIPNAQPLGRLKPTPDPKKTAFGVPAGPPPLPRPTGRGPSRPVAVQKPPEPDAGSTAPDGFGQGFEETSETNIRQAPQRPGAKAPAALPNAQTMIAAQADFHGEIDTGAALDLADKLAREAGRRDFAGEIDTGVALELADRLAAEAVASAASTAKGMGQVKQPSTTLQGMPQLPDPRRPVPPASPVAPTMAIAPQPFAPPAVPQPVKLFESEAFPAPPQRVAPTILEVTPRGLGIATVSGFCEELIRRNERLPATMKKSFTTARDKQAMVRIVICQGESRRLQNNTVIGDLVLANLVPRPRGETTIEVTFVIDASGILQVSARDTISGAEQRASLDLVGGVPQQDVAASRERLQQLRR